MAKRLVPDEASFFPRLPLLVASVQAFGRSGRYSLARPNDLEVKVLRSSQYLLHRCHSNSVNLCHSASEFHSKVTATQMNVERGGLDISMPSKSRNLVDVPVRSR